MLSVIIFAILAMLGYGLSSAISKKLILALGSIKAILYRNIVVSMLLFITLLFYMPEVISGKNILIAFIIAIVGYIPFVTFFKALKTGKVGIVVPISNSAVIVTVALSLIFLKETLTNLQAFAIASIIVGIIIISINFKDFKKSNIFRPSSGVPLALLTCILWGVFWFIWKYPIILLGPFLAAFVQEASMVIYSSAQLGIMKKDFRLTESWKTVILVGFFAAMGTLFFNLGLSIGPVSIVAAITFANPLISTLYGRIVYKERLNTPQWFSVALIIIGIILLSI